MDIHQLLKIASRQSNTQAERILQALQNHHLIQDDQVTTLIQMHEDIVPRIATQLKMPEDVVSDTLVDLYALPEVVEALKGPQPTPVQQMQEDIASIKDAQHDISNMVQLVAVLSMGSMLFSILSVYSLIYM